MDMENGWGLICEDPKSNKLNAAIVTVDDARTLPFEVYRRVAFKAATLVCGWVRLMAPADKMPMHREPVEVFVTPPTEPGGLREVYIGNESEPTAMFRLTPSRGQEVTA